MPEWYEVAKRLRRRCSKKNAPFEKNPKQRKDKLVILTKKLKTVRDKVRSAGFGKGGAAGESKNTNADSALTMSRVTGKS